MRLARPVLRLDIVSRTAVAVTALALALTSVAPMAAQSPEAPASVDPGSRPVIVVTTGILGAVVRDLVGDGADVSVLMGNGVDPHDWSPSARDVEAVHHADLVVANGLGLEEGLHDALEQAAADGVLVFEATDHITVRTLGEGEEDHHHDGDADHDDGDDHDADEDEDHDADHDHGGLDPHFWVDPIAMREVVVGLAPVVASLGLDVTDRAADLETRLDALDAEVRAILEPIPAERRELVTGHESMGYFADHYGFELVGAVIPGLSSQGEVSASQLSTLSAQIREHGVPAIFTEIGTPQAVIDAIGAETGVRIVALPSHNLPDDGSYFTFIRDIATAIAGALA